MGQKLIVTTIRLKEADLELIKRASEIDRRSFNNWCVGILTREAKKDLKTGD